MALEVSNQWKDAIKNQFRYPGYLKVLLALVPDEILENAVVSVSKTEGIASIAQLIDGVSAGREPVATFEQNRWKGDGSQYLPSSTASKNKEIEWWSDTVQFDEEYPIELLFHFKGIFSFAGLFVTWDTETNSWPTDWEVVGLREDGTEQKYRITTTSSSDGFAEAPMDNVKRIVIKIYKWSKPNWRVRINEVMFGTYLNFSNDNITKADTSIAVSPTMEELPTCQFSFTFGNYDKVFDPQLQEGYAKYLARKQLLKAQWGFETSYGQIEWMDPWPLYLSSWQIPANTQEVTLTAQSRLSFMDTEYIKGRYDGNLYTMYDLALHVLENSNIIRETTTEIPWEISHTLAKFLTRAPMPIAATNTLLQLIANATGHVLDTNLRNGYIRIRPPVTETDYIIGMEQQLGDPSFSISDKLKSIKVGIHSYSLTDTLTEVYKTELVLQDTTEITCYFNDNKIIDYPRITVSRGSYQTVVEYARAVILKVKPEEAGRAVTITIEGNVIEESVTVLELYNDPKVPKGIEIEVDNELITEIDTALLLTHYLKEYYKRRNHMTVPYLGYPELEAGDRISIPTNYGEDTGDILSAKLTFNGGFNGTLEVLSTKED